MKGHMANRHVENSLFASLIILSLSLGCGVGALNGRYWIDRAKELNVLKGRDIAALASAGDKLYVSTGNSVFIVTLDGHLSADVTQKVTKQPEDEVTDILFDPARRELWVVLNHNTYLASCYEPDLSAKRCSSSFLDEWMGLHERLQANSPQSSINT